MTVGELANKCDENCDYCKYAEECIQLDEMLEGITAKKLLTIMNEEIPKPDWR